MSARRPNPLRILGMARCLTGAWFVASAATLGRDREYLLDQAGRLFRGDLGATDAPVRSALVLGIAILLLVLGLTQLVRGARWMRRVMIPEERPAPLSLEEVVAVLGERRLASHDPGDTPPPALLQRALGDELGRITRWRRTLIVEAVRATGRAMLVVALVAIAWLATAPIRPRPFLGPFPGWFVVLYPTVAAAWAGLTLLLLGENHPRHEWVDLPHAGRSGAADAPPRFTESRPTLLGWEPRGLGTALGLAGILTQCLLVAWWHLGTISYPLLATSIVRHVGSIVGGVLFFLLGERIVAAATELLTRVQYDSVVVLVVRAGPAWVARAAEVRTESRGPSGPRQIIATVGGAHVRATAPALVPP